MVMKYVLILLLLCFPISCSSNDKGSLLDHETVGKLSDFDLVLTNVSDHPWMLRLLVSNKANHVEYIPEWDNNIFWLDVWASQNNHKIKMYARRPFELTNSGYNILPSWRAVQPNKNVQYFVNLTADYAEAHGNTLPQLTIFDYNRPIYIWVTLATLDDGPTAVEAVSNRVTLNVNQIRE